VTQRRKGQHYYSVLRTEVQKFGLGQVRMGFDLNDGWSDARRFEHLPQLLQAGLAALGERREKVDDLDARLEDFYCRRLLHEARRRSMNRRVLLRADGTALVHR
jgi:hypothetical protein